ncbi:DnaJ C-terminal domain-containing protein [Yunchengibacter salinarum]|uniref:DnaJ C-terminal domain-containing protein n=1 Tax=Yunchengibacter salinarum TaxID=3133399 RepID=UPI0035B63A73
MRDPYTILGVDRNASQEAIKKAYRQLAKELHPDRNKDRPGVADRFKEVSGAYAILGSEEQRRRYDRGEIDGHGNERTTADAGFEAAGAGARARDPFGRDFRRGTGPGGTGGGGFDFDDAEDVFSEFFRYTGAGRKTGAGSRAGAGAGRRRSSGAKGRAPHQRGIDITYELTIGFEEAIRGTTRRLTLNDGRNMDITIPPGIRSGQVIRLAGQGGEGLGGAPKGDALVEIRVAAHPYYTRKGNDILLDLPISLDEAVLGGDIAVPTPRGTLTVRIPRGCSTGRRLRLKGKGVKGRDFEGNMYVTLKVMLPKERDKELEALIKQWSGGNGPALRRQAGLS